MTVTSAQYTLNVLGQNGGVKATIDNVVYRVFLSPFPFSN